MVASVVPKMPGRLSKGTCTSKGGSGAPADNELIDPGNAGAERSQGGLALEQDGAAALFDQGQIANELDRVAQALLGITREWFCPPGTNRPSAAAGKTAGRLRVARQRCS